MNSESLLNTVGPVALVLFAIVFLIWWVSWLILPFIVWNYGAKILRELRLQRIGHEPQPEPQPEPEPQPQGPEAIVYTTDEGHLPEDWK
jgi:hypothetical protein